MYPSLSFKDNMSIHIIYFVIIGILIIFVIGILLMFWYINNIK